MNDEIPRGFLNGLDLLDWLNRLDYSDLLKPIAVAEGTTGLTRDYFNNDEIIYGVRISGKLNRDQDFDGWIIEGLSKNEILKFNEGYFSYEKLE